ncbi:MAG: hypothetical protein QF408_05425 [Pirellulales bacterium]|nr:hypothetical protein [Pirellulales bacterium]
MLANPLDDVRIDIKDNSQETPRQLIQRIRAMLNDPATSRDEISKHLKQLHQILQSHFLRTFDDSFFEEIVFEAPWLTPHAECLRQQQRTLKGMIDNPQWLSVINKSSVSWREQVGSQFEIFADLFFEHDAAVQDILHALNG